MLERLRGLRQFPLPEINPDKIQLTRSLLIVMLLAQILSSSFEGPNKILVSHLGNALSGNPCDDEDILLKCRDVIGKANTLLSSFPHLNPSLLTSLFKYKVHLCMVLHFEVILTTSCIRSDLDITYSYCSLCCSNPKLS